MKDEELHQLRTMAYPYKCGIVINYSHCKGCGRCYEICPADIFGFDEATRLLTVEYPDECCYCGACLVECPCEGALRMELPLACL